MIKHLKDLKITYYLLLILFVIVFVISALLAYYTPYSGRGFVEYELYPISSEINGKIEEIYVKDGQKVSLNQKILKIDNNKLKINLQELEYKYNIEKDRLFSLDYKILESKKEIIKLNKILINSKIDYSRYEKLYSKKLISVSEYEKYKLSYETSKEEFQMAKLSLKSFEIQRGDISSKNNFLKVIESQIKKVKKDLNSSIVKAPFPGEVSIHQLRKGQMIFNNKNYGYIYNIENLSVYVDYMEKSIVNLREGEKTLVVFDAIPGKIFTGHIKKVGFLLESGYTSPEKFQNIKENTRWIRTTGRNRVKIVLDDKLPLKVNISSGSKAAVAVIDENNRFLSLITTLWMKIVAIINYIY